MCLYFAVWFEYLPPKNVFVGFRNLNLQELGIPTHEQLINMYCEKMNIPTIDNFDFYMAFSFFRVAAILQGVYKRSTQGQLKPPCTGWLWTLILQILLITFHLCEGQASSSHASLAGKLAIDMSDIGWSFAAKEGFRLFNKTEPQPLGGSAPQRRLYSTQASNCKKLLVYPLITSQHTCIVYFIIVGQFWLISVTVGEWHTVKFAASF